MIKSRKRQKNHSSTFELTEEFGELVVKEGLMVVVVCRVGTFDCSAVGLVFGDLCLCVCVCVCVCVRACVQTYRSFANFIN